VSQALPPNAAYIFRRMWGRGFDHWRSIVPVLSPG
jgi:hypothetical protein